MSGRECLPLDVPEKTGCCHVWTVSNLLSPTLLARISFVRIVGDVINGNVADCSCDAARTTPYQGTGEAFVEITSSFVTL